MKTKNLILAMLACVFFVTAQAGNPMYRKGYLGNVELGGHARFGAGNYGGQMDFLTTHGYAYGDGVFVGMGTGFCPILQSDGIAIPLLVECKYSFRDAPVSPFVSGRMGFEVIEGDHEYDYLYVFNPSVGCDLHKFFVRLSYQYLGGAAQVDGPDLVAIRGSQIGLSVGLYF